MGGPFRLKKKERKRWRQSAKRELVWAEKCELEGVKLELAAISRRLAAIYTRIALAKRRKTAKSASPK